MTIPLPQLLLLIAVVVVVVGVARLSTPSAKSRVTTTRALIVWLLLFAGGCLMWFLSFRLR